MDIASEGMYHLRQCGRAVQGREVLGRIYLERNSPAFGEGNRWRRTGHKLRRRDIKVEHPIAKDKVAFHKNDQILVD